MDEYPPACPRCGKRDIKIDTHREYTGGGYAESRDIFYCNSCGHEFESESSVEYM